MLVQQAIPYRDPVWTNDGTAIDDSDYVVEGNFPLFFAASSRNGDRYREDGAKRSFV
jgi:hypothetical protein